jgi:hypothetical protein
MKIRNIKLVKNQEKKQNIIINEKHFKADLLLNDVIIHFWFITKHNKYIVDIILPDKSNISKNVIFYHLKKCFGIVNRLH